MNSKVNMLSCNTLYSYRCLLLSQDTANLVMVTHSRFQDQTRTKAKPVNFIYIKKMHQNRRDIKTNKTDEQGKIN